MCVYLLEQSPIVGGFLFSLTAVFLNFTGVVTSSCASCIFCLFVFTTFVLYTVNGLKLHFFHCLDDDRVVC